MDIFANFQGIVLEKIIPLIILLGLLIFVHELGHFLVAKFFKVRVEVFSLGFGKKIVQFVRGHTTYCISLIPLGGYVKMFGDDPNADIPDEHKSEAFSHKPVGQRIWIVLAGPLMNFFFAIVLFALVATLGERALGPTVGDIKKGSMAAQAGFASGDIIQTINGQKVSTWDQIEKKIESSIDQRLIFQVKREDQELKLSHAPKKKFNENPLIWDEYVGEIKGLTPYAAAAVIGVDSSLPNSPAMQAGLRPLDQITHINGKEIKLWRHLRDELAGLIGQSQVSVKGERFQEDLSSKKEPEKFETTIDLSRLSSTADLSQDLKQIGIEIPELYLSQISEEMPAEKAGLLPQDKIISISGEPIQEWQQVIDTVNSFKEDSEPFEFVVLREGQNKEFSISPKINTFMNRHGQEEKRFQVGIGPGIYASAPDVFLNKTPGVIGAVSRGWDQTIEWTASVGTSFVRMLQGRVSSKNVGGIITIGQVASETFKAGLSPYLHIMAIISINLFILNLLPIPILDGGHLVFFTIEALRGAPLSMKKLEIAQQIGLIILMSLMAYALFNDISRVM